MGEHVSNLMSNDIEFDGITKKIWYIKTSDGIWVHVDGESSFVENPQSRRRTSKNKGGGLHPDLVLAPMPGKVTRIAKKVGDVVEVGETVVVLEAMKMEYSLKSQMAGVISEVACDVLKQVELGQTLVRIQPREP